MGRLVGAVQTGLAFVLLAGFIGGLFVLLVMLFELIPMHAARSWPARQGVVAESRLEFTRGGSRNPDSWSVAIRGTYADTGEEFRINRIRYGGFRLGDGRKQAEADTRLYPVGSRVNVHYSPDNPRDTVLEPLAPWDTMLILIGIAVVFISIPPLLYAFRRPLARLSGSSA